MEETKKEVIKYLKHQLKLVLNKEPNDEQMENWYNYIKESIDGI